MPTLNEAIDSLSATVNSALSVMTSAITDLQNPNVDNSEAIARLEGVRDALQAGADALAAADPTPGA